MFQSSKIMYSFTPYPNPNQDHVGFWMVFTITIIVVLCYLALVRGMYEVDQAYRRPKTLLETVFWTKAHIVIPAAVLILNIAAYNSWKPVPEPSNTQVIGTLVDGYETVVSSGKRQNSPAMFIIYQVPEGEVSFRRQSGVVYPQRVILYKW